MHVDVPVEKVGVLFFLPAFAGCVPVPVDLSDAGEEPGGEVADAAVTSPDATPDARLEPQIDAGDFSVMLKYDFEDKLLDNPPRFPDASGNGRTGRIEADGDGDEGLVVEDRVGGGKALVFPADCMAPCAVILEVDQSAAVNPGQTDFAVTADFRLAPGIQREQSIIRKGDADQDEPSWKIEVSESNEVYCVFHHPDNKLEKGYLFAGEVNDTAWHTVRCERQGVELKATLDGATVLMVAEFAINNDKPIRIGGQDPDNAGVQFFGSLDNVVVQIF